MSDNQGMGLRSSIYEKVQENKEDECPICKCDRAAYLTQHCPKCGSCPQYHEIRNYDIVWGDGDIHCTECGTRVRSFDRD